MSKNYNDVKRAATAALKGLIKAIKENLKDEEEIDQLLIELSMSLFASSIDFNLPFDEFASEMAHKQALYTLTFAETMVGLKHDIDAGEDYDAEDI